MSARFEELDYQKTELGELVLRRRLDPILKEWLTEVILNDEFLMSSVFIDGEVALADLGLAGIEPVAGSPGLEIVVGGLGLGYTAQAALRDARVTEMLVVDALGPVIGYHRDGLLPMGRELAEDPRCRLIHADFFAVALAAELGFDPDSPARQFDAVLLDIDHSPDKLLKPSNGRLYSEEGLRALAQSLKPGGRFALWSNDAPEPNFTETLERVFEDVSARIIPFANPYTGGESINSVYLASSPGV